MIDHPFMIKMIDEFEIEDYQSMLTDVTSKGSLSKLIDERKMTNEPFQESEIMTMCAIIALDCFRSTAWMESTEI